MGEAIDLTSTLYPGLLEKDLNLTFALKCRQFVEMVNGSDSEMSSGNNDNQTSVIQSTKVLEKGIVIHCEDLSYKHFNGSNIEHSMNGQSEDVEMEEFIPIEAKNHMNVESQQRPSLVSTNGYRKCNGEGDEMGKNK